MSLLIDPLWGAESIGNFYGALKFQLEQICRRLGLTSIRALRGRTDLLVYRGDRRGETTLAPEAIDGQLTEQVAPGTLAAPAGPEAG